MRLVFFGVDKHSYSQAKDFFDIYLDVCERIRDITKREESSGQIRSELKDLLDSKDKLGNKIKGLSNSGELKGVRTEIIDYGGEQVSPCLDAHKFLWRAILPETNSLLRNAIEAGDLLLVSSKQLNEVSSRYGGNFEGINVNDVLQNISIGVNLEESQSLDFYKESIRMEVWVMEYVRNNLGALLVFTSS